MTSINHVLPPEILSEVFYHSTVTHGPLGLHGALLACRLWYNLATNEPRLWTRISMDTIFASRLHPLSPKAAESFALQCVNLSGCLPIQLFINIDAFRTPGQARWSFRLDTARTIKTKIDEMMDIDHFKGPSSRLETLVIHMEGGARVVGRLAGCYMLRVWRLPLQRLELYNYPLAARCWTNDIPSLTSIALINPFWGLLSPEVTPQRDMRVTLLTLERRNTWRLGDLLIIRVYQALTTLKLLSKPPYPRKSNFISGRYADHNLSVLLPAVNTLFLTGEIPHQVLGALNLPALMTIEIQSHDYRHSLCGLQNTTLHHNVERLEAFLIGRNAHSWTRNLAAVLMGALKLRTFVILPSMLPYIHQASVPYGIDLVVRQG